jgi:antitoxin FitA
MPEACYPHDVGNLQIKDLPPELHAELRKRAVEAGMSQRDFVLDLLRREFSRPSKAEWLRRLQSDPPSPDFDAAEAIRASRAERDAEREEWSQRIEKELRGDDDGGD